MTAFILKCEGTPTGEPISIEGQYLKSFDPEHGDGTGFAEFTRNLAEAKKFATSAAAFNFLNTVPACKPTRPDGRPNKPLWATNWSIAEIGTEQ